MIQARLFALATAGLWLFAALAPAAETAPGERALGFTEALGLLRARNRDLLQAQRSIDFAQADNLSARARPNPNFTVTTAAINPRVPTNADPQYRKIDAIAQLSQLIERGDKRELRIEATRLAIDASRGDYADALRQLTIALAASYYDLLLTQDRVRIADETSALFGRTVAAAELRLKAGDIAPSDLSRIKVDQLRADNDRRQTMADRERARVALAYLVGLDAEAAGLSATDPWPAAEAPDRGAAAAVIEARADVRAAALRVQVAEKARDLARALRSRDVTLLVQYEHFPSQVQNNTVGIGVSVPLFLGYNFEGEIRRTEVGLQATTEALGRTRALALAEINRAWSDLASASERVRRYDSGLLREAQRAAEAAEFAYRNGALGVIDLLDARRVFTATRNDAASARSDLARALVAWRGSNSAYTPASPS